MLKAGRNLLAATGILGRDAQGAARPQSGSAPGTPVSTGMSRGRLYFVQLTLILLAVLAAVRLADLQVIRWWERRTDPLSAVTASPDPSTVPWGAIVDARGVPLAFDRYTYRLVVAPRTLADEDAEYIAQGLAQIVGIPAADTLRTIVANPDSYYTILADLSVEQGQAFLATRKQLNALDETTEEQQALAQALSQVAVQTLPRRAYPQGKLAAHVLGLLDLRRKALSGLESYYRNFLPEDGVPLPAGQQVPLDALDPDSLRYLMAVADRGLILSLDRGTQWILEQELEEGLALYRAQAGAAIAMDPHTGAILGMVSRPTYDPNRYFDAPNQAFVNRAVTSIYEPGSVFKVVTMAAALDAGVAEPTTVFTDTGSITIGQRIIYNSNRQALGRLSLADALAYSNNVVTVQVAQELGVDRFYEYVARFGFGEPTGIDLSDEEDGLVKWPGTEQWSLSDLGTNSFGQGISVTPLQMLRAVAAIANGGYLVRPYLAQARVAHDRAVITEPTLVRRVLRPETAAAMREMMVHTVEAGNRQARVAGYRVAGKSGTAELVGPDGYTLDETNVFFVGFAPADNPRVALLVMMERPDPTISRWAAYTAAPVFARMIHRLMIQMNVPPTEAE